MMKYDLKKMLLILGYRESSVVRVFNYYNDKYNLEIDDIEKVDQGPVLEFLDCLAGREIASMGHDLSAYVTYNLK